MTALPLLDTASRCVSLCSSAGRVVGRKFLDPDSRGEHLTSTVIRRSCWCTYLNLYSDRSGSRRGKPECVDATGRTKIQPITTGDSKDSTLFSQAGLEFPQVSEVL
jgi:hypothetical protein